MANRHFIVVGAGIVGISTALYLQKDGHGVTVIDGRDPASIDAYFKRPIRGNEGPGGHVISKRVGKTVEELKQRYLSEPNVPGSSSFTDYATAEQTVHAGLQRNRDKVINWLKDPNRRQSISSMMPAHLSALPFSRMAPCVCAQRY